MWIFLLGEKLKILQNILWMMSDFIVIILKLNLKLYLFSDVILDLKIFFVWSIATQQIPSTCTVYVSNKQCFTYIRFVIYCVWGRNRVGKHSHWYMSPVIHNVCNVKRHSVQGKGDNTLCLAINNALVNCR